MGLLEMIIRQATDVNGISGKLGEVAIANRLGLINLFGFKGRTLRNIYVPKENDETSEIDLIYITTKGIFVIESKNYVGYIFGTDTNKYWTESVYKGKGYFGNSKTQKYQFYNPILQNKTHIKWLKNYLKKEVPFYSGIVFSECCELKSITLTKNDDVFVCYRNDIGVNMRKMVEKSGDVLTEEEINEIYEALSKLTNADKEVKQKHIENIKRNTENKSCPKCGKKLVLRTTSKGKNAGKQFYGCSGFPSCRFTKGLEQSEKAKK